MAKTEKKKEKKRIRGGWILVFSSIFVGITLFVPLYAFGGWLFLRIMLSIGVSTGLSFLLIYFWWAPNNLFFTFVKEGTSKVVVRADEVRKILIQWKGYTFDREWNVVPEDTWVKDGKVVKEGIGGAKRYKEPQHILGGLRFYGWWPIDDIYIYRFSWTGVAHNGELKHHEREVLDYVMLKEDVYWGKVPKAEDKDLLPLDMELLFTIWVRNPYKALFRIDNWLQTIINRTNPAARNFITSKTFKQLIGMTEAVGEKIYENLVERKILTDEFLGRYGVDVRMIEVKDINPPEEYRRATLAKFEAEREKEKVQIGAKAERFRLDKVYGGIREFGDLGKLIRALEAMEKSPLAASVTVQAVPGIQNLLGGLFGKSSEEATRKEIYELRKIVERAMRDRRR